MGSENSKIRVFILWATSYTGATWISMVMGSHKDVFSVGNPKKAVDRLKKDPAIVCLLHKADCPVWPVFSRSWDPDENLLIQLSKYTGKTCFVVNNPRTKDGWSVVDDPRIELVHFVIKRDLRALAASYRRKNPGIDVMQAIEDWLLLGADTMQTDVNRPGTVHIEHGKASQDQTWLLEQICKGTRLDYTVDHLRFWENDHHMVSGNAGTANTVKAYQGMDANHKQEIYSQFVEKIREGKEISFTDERWRQELDRFDLYVLDKCIGERNAAMGYKRDNFTAKEVRQYASKLDVCLKTGKYSKLQNHLGQHKKYGLIKTINSIRNMLRII